MSIRHGFRNLALATAFSAALLVGAASCSGTKNALPAEAWPGIIHVSVALDKTTREEMVAALGQPVEVSREGGYESLAWTNPKGYIVTFSHDDSPPNVMHFQSRIEARVSGGVVTYLDAR